MAHHDEHNDRGATGNVKDRLAIPILLPVICLVITVALIVGIGEFLLLFGHEYFNIGGEHVYPQVLVALGLSLIFLIGFAIAAAKLAPDDDSNESRDSH